MKNAYLNGVLNFKVYLRVIQKKKRIIVNKPKKRTKIRKKNMSKDSSYILVNCVEKKYLKILTQERIMIVRVERMRELKRVRVCERMRELRK